jgi:hypothetical protein
MLSLRQAIQIHNFHFQQHNCSCSFQQTLLSRWWGDKISPNTTQNVYPWVQPQFTILLKLFVKKDNCGGKKGLNICGDWRQWWWGLGIWFSSFFIWKKIREVKKWREMKKQAHYFIVIYFEKETKKKSTHT